MSSENEKYRDKVKAVEVFDETCPYCASKVVFKEALHLNTHRFICGKCDTIYNRCEACGYAPTNMAYSLCHPCRAEFLHNLSSSCPDGITIMFSFDEGREFQMYGTVGKNTVPVDKRRLGYGSGY